MRQQTINNPNVKIKPALWTGAVDARLAGGLVLLASLLVELLGRPSPAAFTLGYGAIVLIITSLHLTINNTPFKRISLLLVLVPLARLVSASMPDVKVPEIYRLAMVGIPVLAAELTAMRRLRITWTDLGFTRVIFSSRNNLLKEIAVAASGLPLALTGFLLFRPGQLPGSSQGWQMIVSLVIMIIFVGLAEEILFRGLLMQLSGKQPGRLELIISSAAFTIVYLNAFSIGYGFFMGAVGLGFSIWVSRKRSLWGVIAAHTLLTAGMFIWLPTWLH